LDTVEWGFRDLKDVIECGTGFQPVKNRFHTGLPEGRTGGGPHFRGHCALVGLVPGTNPEPSLCPLATTPPQLSSTDAFAAMKSIGIAELNLNGRTTRLVAGGGRDARRVLTALGIKNIEPPSPEKHQKESQM